MRDYFTCTSTKQRPPTALFEVRTLSTMAATTCSLSSIASPFLPQAFRSVATRIQITPSPCLSKMRFQPFRLRTRRSFVIRCARTESKVVTLGSRAPDFEVIKPQFDIQTLQIHPQFSVMIICFWSGNWFSFLNLLQAKYGN